VGVAIFGADNHAAWLASLAAIDWHDMPLNASLRALLDRALQDTFYYEPLVYLPEAGSALWLGGFTLIGLTSLSLAVLDRSPEAVDRTFCILLLAALLMCPLGWVYYLLLAFPPAVGFVSRRNHGHHGTASNKRWTSKIRLISLALGCVLIFIPTPLLMLGQPSALLTISFGSAHFWAVFFFWMATCCDGLISLAAQGVRLGGVARVIHAPAGLMSAFGRRWAGDNACGRWQPK
jgi:hypothetical protein